MHPCALGNYCSSQETTWFRGTQTSRQSVWKPATGPVETLPLVTRNWQGIQETRSKTGLHATSPRSWRTSREKSSHTASSAVTEASLCLNIVPSALAPASRTTSLFYLNLPPSRLDIKGKFCQWHHSPQPFFHQHPSLAILPRYSCLWLGCICPDV